MPRILALALRPASLVLLLGVLLGGCVDSNFDDAPPPFMPVTTGPMGGTYEGGLDSATAGWDDSDGGGPCNPGAEGCACVMGSVCKSGLVCEAEVCVPCTDCAECGNNSCDVVQGESCASCPGDCGPCESCGNGPCEAELAEDCASCPDDCGSCESCGNGSCEAEQGEDCYSCELDCDACPPACGDGDCNGSETCALCPGDCSCPGDCACPQADPCADDGGGWWCGQTIGGLPDVLYTCSGGVTTNEQPCAYGCALCPMGTPDECKAYPGQSDADACAPAECTAANQDACSEYETCVGGNCAACPAGVANCDGTGSCECAGYCGNGGFCCTADNCAFQPQCLLC